MNWQKGTITAIRDDGKPETNHKPPGKEPGAIDHKTRPEGRLKEPKVLTQNVIRTEGKRVEKGGLNIGPMTLKAKGRGEPERTVSLPWKKKLNG